MTKIHYALIAAVFLVGIGYLLNQGVFQTEPTAVPSQIVELKNGDAFDLTAAYVTKKIGGTEQTMLAYNGSIPGPTIRVKQGAEVTINFSNKTDMPALLHSHGVRMENAFDGSQTVQKEMRPGETFAYKLKFPDAGIYWYHPHVKEVYGQGLGLYGAFMVEPEDTAYFPPVNRELPLFLSDLPIENGSIALNKDRVSHSLMGHYGNVMLVNGDDGYVLDAKSGEVVRLYVVNAANARPFNFAIAGMKLKLVGADSGAYERATFVDSVILGPSERAIIDVLIPAEGQYTIQNKTPDKTSTLGTISVADAFEGVSFVKQFSELQRNDATVASIDPYRPYFDYPHQRRLSLTVDIGGGMMGGHRMPDGAMMGGMGMEAPEGGIEWEDTNMMNAMSNTDTVQWHIVDQDSGKKDMDIDDWVFEKGSPVKIRIENDSKSAHPMQHPIHFHGQRFLVVARDGVQQSNLVWKDTVLVKSGETVDIVLDASNPGTWMAHCHISEHLEAGMMLTFTVQ